MRITASWFGSLARRIQGCGTFPRAPTRSSPRTSSSRHAQVCRRARSHQGQAYRWPPDGRPALTAPVRADHSDVRSGRRNGCQIEQRNSGTRKWIGPLGHPLTKFAPYKQECGDVRIGGESWGHSGPSVNIGQMMQLTPTRTPPPRCNKASECLWVNSPFSYAKDRSGSALVAYPRTLECLPERDDPQAIDAPQSDLTSQRTQLAILMDCTRTDL